MCRRLCGSDITNATVWLWSRERAPQLCDSHARRLWKKSFNQIHLILQCYALNPTGVALVPEEDVFLHHLPGGDLIFH